MTPKYRFWCAQPKATDMNPNGSRKAISHPLGSLQSSAADCNEVWLDGTDIDMLTRAKQREKYLITTWGWLQIVWNRWHMSTAMCRINRLNCLLAKEKLPYVCGAHLNLSCECVCMCVTERGSERERERESRYVIPYLIHQRTATVCWVLQDLARSCQGSI